MRERRKMVGRSLREAMEKESKKVACNVLREMGRGRDVEVFKEKCE